MRVRVKVKARIIPSTGHCVSIARARLDPLVARRAVGTTGVGAVVMVA